MAQITESDHEVRPASLLVPVLRPLYSGDEGLIDPAPYVVLRTAATPIGRAPPEGTGVCLSDRRLSRVHATVHADPGCRGVRLVDCDSKNGTFVNGRRVHHGQLEDGDLIRVGGSFLVLRWQPIHLAAAACDELRGTSPAIAALRAAIGLVADSSAVILLCGESGTGKELAARALHRLSGRAGPFVAINCSAIPESLAESQLFGHVPGAFTGAGAYPGFFRAAHGGTLFLDEVTELSPGMQPRLLRALEDRAVIPVGAVAPVSCDVRVIVATNRDPVTAVREGRFRGDLHARLAEIVLQLPPLRERREDILALLGQAMGGALRHLSTPLLQALLLHPWPYNVRELFKVATDLRLRGSGRPVLDLDLVAGRLGLAASTDLPADEATGDLPRREELEALLKEHQGKVAAVARALGYSRRHLYRWLEQLRLDPAAFRKDGGESG